MKSLQATQRSIFAAAIRDNRAALIPFIMAGDPSLEWTGTIVDGLASAGADVIELGVPFSDPIADGPVIQRASERALRSGTTLSAVLDFLRARRSVVGGASPPIVLFSYYNPILQLGLEVFATRARDAGVRGVIVVDLPPEEATQYLEPLRDAGIESIFLASPTTSPERWALIDRVSTGFIYYVSRLGVTGIRERMSETLVAELQALRRHCTQPIAVGFGISTAEQAVAVACGGADAVVMGSVFVKMMEEEEPSAGVGRMCALAAAVAGALKATPRRVTR